MGGALPELAERAGIVTGGASGIGLATARRLLDLGASLVVADIADPSEQPAQRSADRPTTVVYERADTRRFEDAARIVDSCRRQFGRIDFVVANAGVGDASMLIDGDPEHWRTVTETNVLGLAYTVRAALPVMRDQGSGHLVVVASLSGRIAYVGEAMYATSKWAAVGLGSVLRKEAARYGIRTTIIEPGLVDTALSRASPLAQQELAAVEPLTPDDVADVIAFAITRAAHVNITELVIQPAREEF